MDRSRASGFDPASEFRIAAARLRVGRLGEFVSYRTVRISHRLSGHKSPAAKRQVETNARTSSRDNETRSASKEGFDRVDRCRPSCTANRRISPAGRCCTGRTGPMSAGWDVVGLILRKTSDRQVPANVLWRVPLNNQRHPPKRSSTRHLPWPVAHPNMMSLASADPPGEQTFDGG